jgi:hypothetical protein
MKSPLDKRQEGQKYAPRTGHDKTAIGRLVSRGSQASRTRLGCTKGQLTRNQPDIFRRTRACGRTYPWPRECVTEVNRLARTTLRLSDDESLSRSGSVVLPNTAL